MDIKKLLFTWFDKIILLAALAFAFWAGSRLNPPQDVNDRARIARDLGEQIEKQLRESAPPPLPKLDHEKRLSKAYEEITDIQPRARTAWFPPRDMVHLKTVMEQLDTIMEFDHPISGTPRVEPFGGGGGKVTVTVEPDKKSIKIHGDREGKVKITLYDSLMQRHVIVVEITKYVPKPKVYQPKKPEVALKPGSKTVKISWEPPVNTDDRAPIKGYYVYRQKSGEKDYTRLQLVPVAETKGKAKVSGGTLEDSNTAFDTTYTYVVRSYAAGADPPESDPSAPGEVYIPPDVTFVLKSATDKSAMIKVYKWLPGMGWDSKTFPVECGQEIGQNWKGTKAKDGKVQKNVQVDYRTGCFLVDIDPKATTYMIMFNQARESVSSRVVYQDKNGALKEKWRFEPDVAPWSWFGEVPAAAAPHERPRETPRPATRRGGERLEDGARAAEEEDRRRREAEEAANKPRPEEGKKRGGAERPEEIK